MGEPRAVTWYVVPMGTIGKACRAANCQRTIYFIDSPKGNGKQVPVDCDVEIGERRGEEPTATTDGSGVNHYTKCGSPQMFHKAKPPAREQQSLPPRPAKPRACIGCGCTEERACVLLLEDVGLDSRAVEPGDGDEGGDRYTTCSWLSLDPPICNARTCRPIYDELPLAKRLAAREQLEEAATHG